MTPVDLPPEVEVHAWLEAGLEIPAEPETQAVAGIDLARLQTVLDTEWYGGMFQVDAAHETSKLLDALIRLGSKETVELRAGRFKTPLSLDFGVPAPKMILPNRALLVSAAPQREIGAELRVVRGPVTVELGAFDPLSDFERTGPGMRPIGAVDLELVEGLVFHAGATTWLRKEGAEADVGPDGPVWDEVADVGIGFGRDGTTLAVEGLVGNTVAEGVWESGGTVLAAHRFPVGDIELEPAAGWDSATLGGELTHRATGAVNMHLDDWYAVARLSTEAVLPPDSSTELVARAQLQVGF